VKVVVDISYLIIDIYNLIVHVLDICNRIIDMCKYIWYDKKFRTENFQAMYDKLFVQFSLLILMLCITF